MHSKTASLLLVSMLLALLATPAAGSVSRVERMDDARWSVEETNRVRKTRRAAEAHARRTAAEVCGLLGFTHLEIEPESVSYRRGSARTSKVRSPSVSRLSLEVRFSTSEHGQTTPCAGAPEGDTDSRLRALGYIGSEEGH